MKAHLPVKSMLIDERGVTAIVVALVLSLLIACAALAIDSSHLYVARGELQNAADAGALAGSRFLYNDTGTAINTGANQIAYDAATANKSEKVAVEVNWSGGNQGEVQRGHWSFATSTFTANESTAPVDLWNVTTEELDLNPDFINAVKVVTRRSGTPVASFFARIFGHENFQLSAEAVAYIGFAGTLLPAGIEQPIAICEESIIGAGEGYTCSIGRMINSGQNVATSESGGWTSLSQDDACTGGTNSLEVRNLICGDGNQNLLKFGAEIATSGGDIQSAFNQLIQCWTTTTAKTRPWNMTLPVVECPGNNITTCQVLVGAVNINIIWITGAGEDPGYDNAPTAMDGIGDFQTWSSIDPDGAVRWNSFVENFKLKTVDGTAAPYAKKSIYFVPDCTYHETTGVSGGKNFGILAKVPVLVQ
jgi:Flp pilus assembly protein TadG